MASAFGVEFWQKETTRYEAPHDRLRVMADWLRNLPQRRLLDLGCSTAGLRRLLPADFRYVGCDISDHARARLPPGDFLQMDLNQSCDFSAIARRGIDVIHIGGVLEYLHRPGEVLGKLRNLIPPHSPMVLSVINFESQRYARSAAHHAGWVFKPRLDEFLALVAEQGWSVERVAPFLGKKGPGNWWFRFWASRLGLDAPWIRKEARQFILLVRSR